MNLERLVAWKLAPVEQTYSERDSMLYALGLGYGSDPMNASDLSFVYEKDLRAVPSQCLVLGYPGFWAQEPALEIDWKKLLHGEQRMELHDTLPPAGRVRGEFSIDAVEDKGKEKGAVVYQSKTLFDVASGKKIATTRSTLFLRGDGGCGSFGTAPPQPTAIEGEPTQRITHATFPQSALIYRLSGDYNPLHSDPEIARAAGFDRPILHGLCTFGVTVRAAIDALAQGDSARIASVEARFSKPVFPGETIETQFFAGGRFRARVTGRDVVVLDRGTVTLRA
jgi:acyl dehydratase